LQAVLPLWDSNDAISQQHHQREQVLLKARTQHPQEHHTLLERRALIERKKELAETLVSKREREEEQKRVFKMQQERDTIAKKMQQVEEQRDKERRQQELKAIQKEEAHKLANALKAKVPTLRVDVEELAGMDRQQLVMMQVEHMNKESVEKQTRSDALMRGVDHQERAYRKEERVLLVTDYDMQKARDWQVYQDICRNRLGLAKQQHTTALQLRSQFARMKANFDLFVKQSLETKQHNLQAKREANQRQLNQEKEARVLEYRQKKQEVEQEMELQMRREETEQLAAEQQRQQSLELELERKRERERRLAELAERQQREEEAMRLRMEHEAEAERRMQQRREGMRSSSLAQQISSSPAPPSLGGTSHGKWQPTWKLNQSNNESANKDTPQRGSWR